MSVPRLTLLACVLLLIGGTAFAQTFNSNSANANASARIIAPISIAKTTDLNFGDIVASGTAGSVTLSPAGARTNSGGATLGNATNVTAAAFTVGGQASATYAITLPSSITISSGGNSMTVNTFTSTPAATGTIGTGGTQTLAVGATLQVGASQPTGSYTGTFSVSVAYN